MKFTAYSTVKDLLFN